MKDDLAFQQSNRLGHTRQHFFPDTPGGNTSSSIVHFDPFNYLANKAVAGAGGPDKVFGTKPGVAAYTPTDLGTEADKAAKANAANMPDVMALLEKILPGYGEMIKTGSANTLALLKGQIPQDVQDQVQRSSAYRSLMGGFGGSSMSKALTARDLGRTSLDLTQLGGNAAQKWAGLAEASTAPWMVTGAQQADTTMRNNLYSQITEQNRLNVASAPDPGAAGIFNLQTALGSMAASFGIGSALGGMRGGGAPSNSTSTGNNYAGTYNGVPYTNANIPTANAVSWGSYNAGNSPYGPYAGGYQMPGG